MPTCIGYLRCLDAKAPSGGIRSAAREPPALRLTVTVYRNWNRIPVSVNHTGAACRDGLPHGVANWVPGPISGSSDGPSSALVGLPQHYVAGAGFQRVYRVSYALPESKTMFFTTSN